MVHCFGPPSLSLWVHESAFMWFTLPGYMSFLMLMSMFVVICVCEYVAAVPGYIKSY